MTTKRTTMNEYIINRFLNDEFPGYSSSHNGIKYFKLENKALYGGKTLQLKTDMGWRIIRITKDNVTECAELIQETLLDLPQIVDREKSINEYCLKNPWTYSGT